MSASTVHKLACRLYGALSVVNGAAALATTKVLLIAFIAGICDTPQMREALASAGLDQKTMEMFLGSLGLIFAIFAVLEIVLGVLAWKGRVWAMVVGSVWWLFSFSITLRHGLDVVMQSHKLELAKVVVFVALTLMALISRRQPAAPLHASSAPA